jgi:hypothetical protein
MFLADPDTRRGARHVALVFLGFTACYTLFFAPVLFSGRLLVLQGDAALYHYPAVFGPRDLWDPLLASGYPRMADPQMMLWYPLALPLSLTGWEWLWNPFLLAPYVLGSCFTYGFLWRSTRSALAAAVAGLVFGLSAFLVWHQPHVAIVHAAAWVPLVLWSLDELRRRVSRGWLATLALAVANCFLAGHTQIIVYGLTLGGLFVLWHLRGAPAGWKRFGLAGAAGVALGLGLCAIQLFPTAEAVPHSERGAMTFDSFTSFSLPWSQLPTLLFPHAFGGSGLPPGEWVSRESAQEFGLGVHYFGQWGLVEVAGYCGLVSLVLAAAGFLSNPRARQARFWALATVAAVVLALGRYTPVARLLYLVPVLNCCRCPGRFALWLELSVAVQAGFGVAALRSLPRGRALRTLVLAGACVTAVVGVAWVTLGLQMAHTDLFASAPPAARSLWPWENLAIGLPLGGLALGLCLLWAWVLCPGRLTATALLGGVAVELMLFAGLAGYWDYTTPFGVLESPTEYVANLGEDLRERHERVLSPTLFPTAPLSEHSDRLYRDAAPVNLSGMWGVPNAGGYPVLGLSRYTRLVPGDRPTVLGHTPELFSIRYLLRPVRQRTAHGIRWDEVALHAPPLGGDGTEPNSVAFVTGGEFATRVGLIADLEGAAALADGVPVAEVIVETPSGPLPAVPLRVGVEVVDEAWERADVHPTVCHRLPARTEPERLQDGARRWYSKHHSVALLPLGARVPVSSVTLRWLGPRGADLKPLQLTLIDDSAGACHPVRQFAAATDHWRETRTLSGGAYSMVENLRPVRRVWLVSRVVRFPAEDMPSVLLHGRKMPDGTAFEPYRTALVEEDVPFRGGEDDPTATACITRHEPHRVTVTTRADAETFLVLGDVYYPGWQARVDGSPTRLYRADYALRGVIVPPGEHEVEFVFRPGSFYIGTAVTGVSAAVLLGVLVVRRRRNWLCKPTGERGNIL